MTRPTKDVSNTSRLFAEHGGRLALAATHYPEAPKPWIDLSTGVNPKPYPAPRASRLSRMRLPEPQDLAALEAAAALCFGVAPERVCATPGLEIAIQHLPGLLAAPAVCIASPTYASHDQAWRRAGAVVAHGGLDSLASAAHSVVLVNPNNPDGQTLSAPQVLGLAERLNQHDGWLVVDEAFVETAPELSVAAHAGGRLVVLRSFGKFYGLAGLRLGFVLAEPALIAALRERLGAWPISVDAMAAGVSAYRDRAWAEETRRRLNRDVVRMDSALFRAGFHLVGGTSLFRLAQAPDAPARFERLAEAGVLVRPFAYQPTWLRFGMPPAAAWARVEAALENSAP
ncbi:MAG: threonine-phosphate decarboxylase CobD [Caulobacteraceae bacterium]